MSPASLPDLEVEPAPVPPPARHRDACGEQWRPSRFWAEYIKVMRYLGFGFFLGILTVVVRYQPVLEVHVGH